MPARKKRRNDSIESLIKSAQRVRAKAERVVALQRASREEAHAMTKTARNQATAREDFNQAGFRVLQEMIRISKN